MNTNEAFEVLKQALTEELEKTKNVGTVLFSNGDTANIKKATEKLEQINSLITSLNEIKEKIDALISPSVTESNSTNTTNLYMEDRNKDDKSTKKHFATKGNILNQRDMMRKLFAEFGNNPDKLIKEYAAAERRGDVVRKANNNQISPEMYAYQLLADAKQKGWLEGFE